MVATESHTMDSDKTVKLEFMNQLPPNQTSINLGNPQNNIGNNSTIDLAGQQPLPDANDLFSLLGCTPAENSPSLNTEQFNVNAHLNKGEEVSSFSDFSTIKTLLDDMVNFVGENEKVAKKYDESGMVVNSPYTGDCPEDVDRFRDFDVYLIDAQKTWPDRINTIGRVKAESRVCNFGNFNVLIFNIPCNSCTSFPRH